MDFKMIRLLDFLFSLFGLFLVLPLLAVLYIIGLFDTGSPIFTQKRVGRDKKPFTLVKFRTMATAGSLYNRVLASYEGPGSPVTAAREARDEYLREQGLEFNNGTWESKAQIAAEQSLNVYDRLRGVQ